MTTSLLAFAAVAALITVTPGLDTALTVRMALRDGRRAGLAAAAGISAGLLLWGAATGLGITLVFRASQVAYDVLRGAGAVWLVVLGLRSILAARKARDRPEPQAAAADPAVVHGWRGDVPAFRAGLLSNLLNPKIGIFYLTFLPQFVPAGANVLLTTLLLAGVHAVEGIAWLALVAWLVSRAREVMIRGSVQRALERLTGVVLVGLGLRLALERG